MSSQPRDFLTRYLSTAAPLRPWGPPICSSPTDVSAAPLSDPRQYKAPIEQAGQLVAGSALSLFVLGGGDVVLHLKEAVGRHGDGVNAGAYQETGEVRV